MKFVAMFKPVIALFIFTLFTLSVFAQKVFYTKNKTEAKVIIYITTKEYEANWIVLKTKWSNQAEKGIWYKVKYKNQADLIVLVTTNKYEADKVVYFTDYKSKIKF
jgi:hypothetical protein